MPSSCRFGDEPDGLGVERCRRQIERLRVSIVARRGSLRWYATTCSETVTRPKQSSSPPRSSRAALLDRVSVSFFACVYQSPGTARRSALPAVEIEPLDAIRLAGVEVDGAVVHRRVRALALDVPSTAPSPASTTVHESALAERSDDARSRVVAAGPDAAAPVRAKLRQHGRTIERLVAERRAVPRRRAAPRTQRRARGRRGRGGSRGRGSPPRPAAEQRLGLAHEVLVERVLARDEHGQAVAAPPGTAPLLAQARDRAGKPTEIDAVEQADVDAELERIGRGRRPAALPRTSRRSISRRCAGV